MKLKSLIAIVFAFGLLAAACGDDDSSTDSGGMSPELQEYADALAASFENSEDDLPLTETEVQCVSDEAVQVFGLERLQEFGTPEELATGTEEDFSSLDPSDEEIEAVVDAFFDCADIVGLVNSSITENAELTEEQVSCVEGILDGDRVKAILTSTLIGDEPDDSFFADLLACQ